MSRRLEGGRPSARAETVSAVALSVVLLLVGCEEAEPASEPGGSQESAQQPAEQRASERVERLRIALPSDAGPVNLFAQHEEFLTELVYDKLLAPSPYVEDPQPWLARSVTSIDHSTWEVTLRDDVVWHDGEPFTAADVAFTVEYFTEAPTGRWTHHVDEVPEIASTEVVDEGTVRFECAYPCPDLGPVTLADVPIIPEHVWAEVSEPRESDRLPVGTGPYELVDYDAATGYRFEAHDEHFAGRPLVDELVMPVIEEASATFTALRSDEIDAAARPVPPELLESFEADEGIDVAETAPLEFPELRLNYQRPPLDEHELRRAVSLAIDRDELLDVVLLGHGRAATSGYPHPDSPWTNPDLSTPSDPEESRQVLDEAGFVDTDGDGIRESQDGQPIALELKVTGSEPTHVRAAELLVEHLGRVGIEVEVRQLDAGSMGDLFSSRDFEAYIATITAHGVADPTQFIMSHRSGYLWAYPDEPYPEWGELWERWRDAATVEERTEVSFEMQELFNRRPTAIPLLYPDVHWAYRPQAYDGWAESRGYGIVHKWSLLPRDVAAEANAVVGE